MSFEETGMWIIDERARRLRAWLEERPESPFARGVDVEVVAGMTASIDVFLAAEALEEDPCPSP